MRTIDKKINAFEELAIFLTNHLNKAVLPGYSELHTELELAIQQSFIYNGWFTYENVQKALSGIAGMLGKESLAKFGADLKEPDQIKTVAVIMAGNIPAVGFHDLMCVLLSGHKILIKMSSDDQSLIPVICKVLVKACPEFKDHILFADGKLQNFDAVIATGNNNSARHFEYYFGKYPNIIRKNRNSVAILSGRETKEDLQRLGEDIFSYFGLGCRNVSHLKVPEGYDFHNFFEAIFPFGKVIDNKKYGNNYDYHRALFLLEKIDFLDNNFMILRKNEALATPVSVVHYSTYKDNADLFRFYAEQQDKMQCIVGNFDQLPCVPFGKTQQPSIDDFADQVNTLDFLKKLG